MSAVPETFIFCCWVQHLNFWKNKDQVAVFTLSVL